MILRDYGWRWDIFGNVFKRWWLRRAIIRRFHIHVGLSIDGCFSIWDRDMEVLTEVERGKLAMFIKTF